MAPQQHRPHVLPVPLSEAERETLEEAAATARKPLDAWLREKMLEAAHEIRMRRSAANDATVDLFDATGL